MSLEDVGAVTVLLLLAFVLAFIVTLGVGLALKLLGM